MRRLIAVIVLVLVLPARADIFDVGGKRPDTIVVTQGGTPPDPLPRLVMLRQLAGVVAVLDTQGLVTLRGAAKPAGSRDQPQPDWPVAFSLFLSAGERSKRLDLLRAPDGRWFLVDAPDDRGRRAAVILDAEEMLGLIRNWPSYKGGYDLPEIETPGVPVELAPPLTPGWAAFDDATVRRRLHRGGSWRFDPADRDLAQQTMFVRLPRGYHPRHPAGVLVWIDPTDQGSPPANYWDACDQLNLISVGVMNMGNDRPVFNRLQSAFDALATVCERYSVDHERLYVTGFSGGGRCTSRLWACFADVWNGAIAVGALDVYEQTQGAGRTVFPAAFDKPKTPMLALARTRRLAVVSGPGDFNYDPIRSGMKVLEDDKFAVRFFDVPGLAHEIPGPERMNEIVAWIDEPVQLRRAEARAAGDIALREFLSSRTADATLSQADRQTLEAIIERAPWSPAAWKAAELLGIVAPTSDQPPAGDQPEGEPAIPSEPTGT